MKSGFQSETRKNKLTIFMSGSMATLEFAVRENHPWMVSVVLYHAAERSRGKKRAPCGDIFRGTPAARDIDYTEKTTVKSNLSTSKVSPQLAGRLGKCPAQVSAAQ